VESHICTESDSKSFVEMNGIGVRKILKKYDKRSTSTTKELYLARQVDVQPVFNCEVDFDSPEFRMIY